MERVELHTYTKQSKMRGLTIPEELINKAKKLGMKAVAITDIANVRAFPEVQKYLEKCKDEEFKVIYGMEGYLKTEENNLAYHITILARNKIGLKNLYKIVSYSHLENSEEVPYILKNVLDENREGLLIGATSENGEIITALKENKTEQEIEKIISYYDYLEVQEPRSEKEKEEIESIIKLAEKLEKLVVAVGITHFIEPEDKKYMNILLDIQEISDKSKYQKAYFKSTNEMLKGFQYLGKEKAEEIVIENTNKITDMCEKIKPIGAEGKEKLSLKKYDYEELETLTLEKAHELYGKTLPKEVQDRITQELESIKKNEFEGMYMLAQKITKEIQEEGFVLGSRGGITASLIANLIGITEINPLKPHYRCPLCKYAEFGNDEVKNGLDLPDKKCPICETKLIKDGMDIPFEEFAGIDGNRAPDIDLNIPEEMKRDIEIDLKAIFGKDRIVKAGTVGAKIWVIRDYDKEKKMKLEEDVEDKLLGVQPLVGEHPGKYIILPQNKEIYDFTPTNKSKKDNENVTTHFDYHALSNVLGKTLFDIDILTHPILSTLYKLQEGTEVNVKQIPLDDKRTIELLSKAETLGIPEFGTNFARMLIDKTKPKNFEEFVKISGLAHGANTWLDNGEELIGKEGKKLSELIAFRDDVFLELQEKGIETEIAFEISEIVRKGRTEREPKWKEYVEIMKKHNVPEWYVKSCEQIKYLFPKAHATVYVLNNYRIAWFKVHFPEQFYNIYLEENANEKTMQIVKKGKEAVNSKIDEIKNNKERDYKENEMCDILEIAKEMCERGIKLN